MIVHYKLPNMGWLDSHAIYLDDLWEQHWVNDKFVVDTEEEYDFLEGYGLIKGKQLHLTLHHTSHKPSFTTCYLWLKDINTNTFNPRIRNRDQGLLPGQDH